MPKKGSPRPNLIEANRNTRFSSGIEAVSSGRKGGLASAKKRREQAAMRETAMIVMQLTLKEGKPYDITKAQCLADLKDANVTVKESIVFKVSSLAMQGKPWAVEMIREMIGEDSEPVTVSPIDSAIEELRKMEAEDDERHGADPVLA